AGIEDRDSVTLAHFVELPVCAKRVCLTDISDNGIKPLRSRRVGDIDDMMVRVIHHWTHQMVEARVQSHEGDARCCLHNICACEEDTCLAYDVLTRFNPQFQLATVLLTKFSKRFAQSKPEVVDVRGDVSFLIRNLEPAAEVEETQVREIAGDAEKNVGHLQENVRLRNIRSGMHMETVDFDAVLVNRLHDTRQLIDRYTELGVTVSC